jgi:hypothetical protein
LIDGESVGDCVGISVEVVGTCVVEVGILADKRSENGVLYHILKEIRKIFFLPVKEMRSGHLLLR